MRLILEGLEGGSPGLVVMGRTHVPNDVGSRPGPLYWMGIFSHKFVVKIVMFVRIDQK